MGKKRLTEKTGTEKAVSKVRQGKEESRRETNSRSWRRGDGPGCNDGVPRRRSGPRRQTRCLAPPSHGRWHAGTDVTLSAGDTDGGVGSCEGRLMAVVAVVVCRRDGLVDE